jgi:hypothetical protein
MKVEIPCPFCNGTGFANNPPVFYNEGELPEEGKKCKVCEGKGTIEEQNPEGLRVAMLVAKRIVADYPNFKNWETIYHEIVTNVKNAVNYSISAHGLRPLIINGIDVFHDDVLPVDKVLENWIESGNYIQEAKTILKIQG